MITVAYDKKCHLYKAKKWLEARQMSPMLSAEFPSTGLVAIHNDIEVGVGFVRHCEGGIVFFDSFVTNPECSPDIRNQAMDLIGNSLLSTCKAAGIRHIFVMSADKNTLERCHNNGFIHSDYKVLTMQLES